MTNRWDLVKHYLAPVAGYLEMDGVTDIMIDRYDRIYIEKNGKLENVPETFNDNNHVETLIRQIANALDQPVDNEKHPILDARLPATDGKPGARINAVLTPVATQGACITIRVFPSQILVANELLNKDVLTLEMLNFLKLAVLCRCNIIISGGTGSGKTTLMNLLANEIPKDERIAVIEDTAELKITAPFLVTMEAPRRKVDFKKDSHVINLAVLLQNVLRQRPDRILVGELRSADAASSFVQAINTGHQGCMTTLHANSSVDAIARLEGLFAAGASGLPYEVVKSQVRANIELIVQVQRIPMQGRRIVEIAEITERKISLLWQWDYNQKIHIHNDLDMQTSAIIKLGEKFGIQTAI